MRLFYLYSQFVKYCGIHRTDARTAEMMDKAYADVLNSILHSSTESSRNLVITLAAGVCKALALKGSHGDVSLLANKIGITRGFAKRILHASLNGTVDALRGRRKRATAFESTEWAARFKEFVFRPEQARPVPG